MGDILIKMGSIILNGAKSGIMGAAEAMYYNNVKPFIEELKERIDKIEEEE